MSLCITHHVVTDRLVVIDDGQSGQDIDLLLELLQMLQILWGRENVSDLGDTVFIGKVHLLFNSHIPVANWMEYAF